MPNLYDQDLRKRTIAYWQETNNKSKTARIFGICRNTLNSWIALYHDQGNTEPKKAQPTGVKHIITDLDSFERYVKAKQFDTAKQLREQYLKDHPDVSISYNAFVDTLHRINWTFKKTFTYKESDPVKQQGFSVCLAIMAFWFGLTNILFMDETGFYQRQSYHRSWSPVGTPCYAKMDANKGKRLNLIGAMSMAEFKLIAPVTFEGGCKRDTVENWLHTLGQSLPKDELDSYPQRFLIMDNARFHRGGDLKQIAEKYNLTLLYFTTLFS